MLSLYLRHTLLHGRQLLAGVDGIRDFIKTERKIVVSEEEHDGRLVERMTPCFLTSGSNVQGICSLPQVDVASVTSNNIHQIFSEFGISAAQRAIEDNLVEAIASAEKHVSHQHIRLIAAAMCNGGYPAPLTFSGMTSQETATWFKRATFERCLDSFCGAGVSAREDGLMGVSEAIVVGAQIRVGTGANFEILADEDRIHNEGLITEARSRMQYTMPPIADFLLHGPSHGLTDESVQFRFDSKRPEERKTSGRGTGARGAAAVSGTHHHQPRRGEAPLGYLTSEAGEDVDAAAFFEGKEVERLYYAKGPLLPHSPILRPRTGPNGAGNGGDESEILYYGPSRLLIPSSPKPRKKNESRKNNKRRFGDRNLTEDDLESLQHLVEAAPHDTRKKKPKKQQIAAAAKSTMPVTARRSLLQSLRARSRQQKEGEANASRSPPPRRQAKDRPPPRAAASRKPPAAKKRKS
jgi:hypothetical protein